MDLDGKSVSELKDMQTQCEDAQDYAEAEYARYLHREAWQRGVLRVPLERDRDIVEQVRHAEAQLPCLVARMRLHLVAKMLDRVSKEDQS